MPNVIIDGQRFAIPEGKTAEDVYNEVKGITPAQKGGSFTATAKPSSGKLLGDIDPDTLQNDKDWVQASRILYKSNTGKDFAGSNKDLAEYGLDTMGWFNSNSPMMALDAAKMAQAPMDERKAFLYMMETYDDLSLSWGGAGRFIKGAALDPLNWTGLVSLGLGTAETQAGRLAGKAAIKQALKAGLTAGIENAAQAGVQNAARQSVEISAEKEGKDGFSFGELAGQAAIGGAIGGVLGTGLAVGRNALAKPLDSAVADLGKTADSPIANAAPEVPTAPTVEPQQLSLNLGTTAEDMSQARMSRIPEQAKGVPPEAAQPGLPMDMPLERRLDQIPESMQGTPKETISEMTDRVSEKWGVDHQMKMDLQPPPGGERPLYDGQGNLFDTMPTQVKPDSQAAYIAGKAANEAAAKTGEAAAKAAAAAPSGSRLAQALDVVSKLMKATDGDAANAIVKAIKDAVDDTGWRILPGGKTEISAKVKEATDLLASLKVDTPEDAQRLLASAAMTSAQREGLKAAIADAGDKLTQARLDLLAAEQAAKTGGEKAVLRQQLNQLEGTQDLIAKLQLASSSNSGAELAGQRGRLISGVRREFASPEEIMRNNPSLTKSQAEDEFLRAFAENREKVYQLDQVKEITAKLDAARDVGDWANIEKLWKEREALVSALSEDAAKKSGMFGDSWKKANAMFTEGLIGSVFSIGTAVINTIPSALKLLYKPTLNALMDNNASLKSIGANYSAMFAANRAAIDYAMAVFKYEQNPFFSQANTYLGHEAAIPGLAGRIIRTIPRFLESTDAYFAQMHYRGFVAQEAYNVAAKEAEKMGLKGAKADAHIADHVKRVTENMFTKNVDHDAQMDLLFKQGISRGYSGERLQMYVKTEMNKHPEFYAKPTDIVGRSYTQDLLYKTEFSGDNPASSAAKSYEQFMNNNALGKFMLQLFIRTPIRVFEEGMRLTPGLNLVTPKFLDDLRGLNGSMRQVRANGEAVMSMAFGGTVMAMYAAGAITGGGPSNYKQGRTKQNTREWQPYTIYLPGGTTISYRNLDPFATPLKMVVNALDNFQEYQLRKAQGEYAADPSKQLLANIGLAFNPVIQSVKDANLTEGISQLANLIKMLQDPAQNEGAIQKFMNEKAKMLVPSMIGKTKTLLNGGDTPMPEAATLGQALSAKFDPYSQDVPTQRDVLGNKRYMGNSPASYFGIGVNTAIADNISDKAKAVIQELSDIETANNVSFMLPTKMPAMFGNVDLRTQYMPDGKTTWYDRIYDIMQKMAPEEALYSVLVENKDNTTFGTPTNKGTKYQLANSVMTKYRNAAAATFMSEYEKAQQAYMNTATDKVFGKAGMFDNVTIPR